MKKAIILVVIFFCLFFSGKSKAQVFSKVGTMSLDPRQVITENYSTITISGIADEGLPMNIFNRENPYTYLQLVSDGKRSDYHILLQTSFTGQAVFLACSKNLYPYFSKKEKPMHIFNQCMAGVREELLSIAIWQKSIDCVMQRLAYCGQ